MLATAAGWSVIRCKTVALSRAWRRHTRPETPSLRTPSRRRRRRNCARVAPSSAGGRTHATRSLLLSQVIQPSDRLPVVGHGSVEHTPSTIAVIESRTTIGDTMSTSVDRTAPHCFSSRCHSQSADRVLPRCRTDGWRDDPGRPNVPGRRRRIWRADAGIAQRVISAYESDRREPASDPLPVCDRSYRSSTRHRPRRRPRAARWAVPVTHTRTPAPATATHDPRCRRRAVARRNVPCVRQRSPVARTRHAVTSTSWSTSTMASTVVLGRSDTGAGRPLDTSVDVVPPTSSSPHPRRGARRGDRCERPRHGATRGRPCSHRCDREHMQPSAGSTTASCSTPCVSGSSRWRGRQVDRSGTARTRARRPSGSTSRPCATIWPIATSDTAHAIVQSTVDRDSHRWWPGPAPSSYASFTSGLLAKTDQGRVHQRFQPRTSNDPPLQSRGSTYDVIDVSATRHDLRHPARLVTDSWYLRRPGTKCVARPGRPRSGKPRDPIRGTPCPRGAGFSRNERSRYWL